MFPGFAVLLVLTLQTVPAVPEAPSETVIIDCPGLSCAACRLGVLEGSTVFAGVRSVRFDAASSRLTLTVDPGFDRHHELILAIQRLADPIEMFRATLVE